MGVSVHTKKCVTCPLVKGQKHPDATPNCPLLDLHGERHPERPMSKRQTSGCAPRPPRLARFMAPASPQLPTPTLADPPAFPLHLLGSATLFRATEQPLTAPSQNLSPICLLLSLSPATGLAQAHHVPRGRRGGSVRAADGMNEPPGGFLIDLHCLTVPRGSKERCQQCNRSPRKP